MHKACSTDVSVGHSHPCHAEPPCRQATGPWGWVPGGDNPGKGGRMDGAGTQVGTDKWHLRRFQSCYGSQQAVKIQKGGLVGSGGIAWHCRGIPCHACPHWMLLFKARVTPRKEKKYIPSPGVFKMPGTGRMATMCQASKAAGGGRLTWKPLMHSSTALPGEDLARKASGGQQQRWHPATAALRPQHCSPAMSPPPGTQLFLRHSTAPRDFAPVLFTF